MQLATRRLDPVSAGDHLDLDEDELRLVALWRRARALRRQAEEHFRNHNEADRLCNLALTDIEMMLRQVES
jgi:hypothetical protein